MKHRTRTLAATTLALAAPLSVQLATPAARADGGDTTSPRATWDFRYPDSRGWFNHDVPVAVDVTDETGLDADRSRVWVTDVDGSIHGLDVPRTSLQLTVSANGVTEIDYDVYDLAGNEGGGEVLIYLDKLAPTLTTTGLPPDGATVTRGSVVPVGASCTDEVTGVDTSGISSCGFTSGTTGGITDGRLDTGTPGPLTVVAQAVDVAGNPTTVTRHYTVTGTPPTTVRPRCVAKPAIFFPEGGRGRSGDRVAATPGQWTGAPTSYAFQWLRNGVPITGATDSSYVVDAADVGSNLRVRVTATNARGAGSAATTPLRIRR